ncbi:MAG: alpha/beta fold hydrolase [bacterium]|nr:alpha/beta fold hydrolase [bacterium]
MTAARVVCLHGFTGSPASWDAVVEKLPADFQVERLALSGHDHRPPTVDGFVEEVDRLAGLLRRPCHLAGYSLGGRVALGLLARHPDLFTSATLIGAHPGLRTEAERRQRRAADEELSRRLKREGIEAFVDFWESLPLFVSQGSASAEALELQRAIRLGHDAHGLAHSLRALGLGAMPDYGADLERIDLPVHLMAGEADLKFARLARSMAASLPRATVEVVPSAGHNLILEAPGAVASAIERQARFTR